jgi:hypothetical protein
MMSILHYNMGPRLRTSDCIPSENQADKRYERDALGDLKHGLDLIFELKAELDKLHPISSETLIRLLSH